MCFGKKKDLPYPTDTSAHSESDLLLFHCSQKQNKHGSGPVTSHQSPQFGRITGGVRPTSKAAEKAGVGAEALLRQGGHLTAMGAEAADGDRSPSGSRTTVQLPYAAERIEDADREWKHVMPRGVK